jgi:hypothetical protein
MSNYTIISGMVSCHVAPSDTQNQSHVPLCSERENPRAGEDETLVVSNISEITCREVSSAFQMTSIHIRCMAPPFCLTVCVISWPYIQSSRKLQTLNTRPKRAEGLRCQVSNLKLKSPAFNLSYDGGTDSVPSLCQFCFFSPRSGANFTLCQWDFWSSA